MKSVGSHGSSLSLPIYDEGKLIEEKEGCTHAYHVQFSPKEALDAFESHPAFLAVEAYCKGSLPVRVSHTSLTG
jgi:hypothetical protein